MSSDLSDAFCIICAKYESYSAAGAREASFKEGPKPITARKFSQLFPALTVEYKDGVRCALCHRWLDYNHLRSVRHDVRMQWWQKHTQEEQKELAIQQRLDDYEQLQQAMETQAKAAVLDAQKSQASSSRKDEPASKQAKKEKASSERRKSRKKGSSSRQDAGDAGAESSTDILSSLPCDGKSEQETSTGIILSPTLTFVGVGEVVGGSPGYWASGPTHWSAPPAGCEPGPQGGFGSCS